MAKRESAFVVAISPFTDSTLIGKRSKKANNAGKWDFFGGRLKKGEDPKAGARREFIEETGIYPTNLKPHVEIHTKKKIIHAFLFMGLTENGLSVKLNDEHDEFRWIPNEEDVKTDEFTQTSLVILGALTHILDEVGKLEIDKNTKYVINVTVKE